MGVAASVEHYHENQIAEIEEFEKSGDFWISIALSFETTDKFSGVSSVHLYFWINIYCSMQVD